MIFFGQETPRFLNSSVYLHLSCLLRQRLRTLTRSVAARHLVVPKEDPVLNDQVAYRQKYVRQFVLALTAHHWNDSTLPLRCSCSPASGEPSALLELSLKSGRTLHILASAVRAAQPCWFYQGPSHTSTHGESEFLRQNCIKRVCRIAEVQYEQSFTPLFGSATLSFVAAGSLMPICRS